MKVFIVFALVCCLSMVFAVSSAEWTEEDDDQVEDFGEEFSLDDVEDKQALYEAILEELIASSDPKPQSCNRVCRRRRCISKCGPMLESFPPQCPSAKCRKCVRRCNAL